MKEISLNILDIIRNSVRAGATKIDLRVSESVKKNMLEIEIEDNGEGMDRNMLIAVEDPFVTSRLTRKVGLGIPLLKQHAELTGGKFTIESKKGTGTRVVAGFVKDHIDRQPMGDLPGVLRLLLFSEKSIDFNYLHCTDKGEYSFSSSEARQVLGVDDFTDISLLNDIVTMLTNNLLEIEAELN